MIHRVQCQSRRHSLIDDIDLDGFKPVKGGNMSDSRSLH